MNFRFLIDISRHLINYMEYFFNKVHGILNKLHFSNKPNTRNNASGKKDIISKTRRRISFQRSSWIQLHSFWKTFSVATASSQAERKSTYFQTDLGRCCLWAPRATAIRRGQITLLCDFTFRLAAASLRSALWNLSSAISSEYHPTASHKNY